MTDHTDNSGIRKMEGYASRVAYTLNNEQPVRCTHISDEPLFYIDAPVTDMIEDDEASLSLYEESLLGFSDDTEVLAPISSSPVSIDTDLLFSEQFGFSNADGTELEQTIAQLRQSRLVANMLDFALDQGVTIQVAPQQDAVFYDRMKGTITLRPDLSSLNQALLLVRELRRVWQHRQGALLHPLLFHPDHAIVINRVQAADLMSVLIRAAWELRLAGDHGIWDAIDQNGYHDLTRAFAREALMDFRSLNNGRAMAAVFETWFLSERCRAFDRTLIQKMLADYQGYVFRAGHEDTSRVLTQQLISALGTMPYGKNYLSAYAATILADPIFTDIRDRSNANFLWFIKFEQSFRATERDLQQEGSVSPSSLQGPARHASDKTATILRLPARGAVPATKAARAAGGRSAVVVDIGQWRNNPRVS